MKLLSFITLLVLPMSLALGATEGRQIAASSVSLETGDYVWHPETSPVGAVVIIVSLPDQVLTVYRNGIRIGRSTISSGKSGHDTPTGIFTILQKKSPASLEYFSWSADAIHGTPDLEWCCDAWWRIARPCRLPWLRASTA